MEMQIWPDSSLHHANRKRPQYFCLTTLPLRFFVMILLNNAETETESSLEENGAKCPERNEITRDHMNTYSVI